MNRNQNLQASVFVVRRGVTLIEVTFAMGVILIGLLGLVSILPLAGRRAQESVSLSVGSAMGQQVFFELQTKQFLTNGRMRPVRRTTATAVTNLTVTAPVSYCVDPLFAASNTPPGTLDNGYSAAFFPYYRPSHDMLQDPSTNSATWPGPAPQQPRMTRVGIARFNDPSVLINVSEALEIAETPDDLFVSRPDDRTRYANFKNGELEAVGGGLEYGKRIPRGEFSWIATVNPFPGGQYASVSVVVMRKRVRNFASPTGTTPAADPQDNGIGERLAYVTYASGFSGGAGGVVHLVASDKTEPSIKSDDWVMMSRAVGGDVYHRWYRVVGVNGEPEFFTTNGSLTTDDTNLGARIVGGAGQTVWRRKVHLDGSDWDFNFNVSGVPRGYADDTPADNTYVTLVSNVVSVTERTVLLSDL